MSSSDTSDTSTADSSNKSSRAQTPVPIFNNHPVVLTQIAKAASGDDSDSDSDVSMSADSDDDEEEGLQSQPAIQVNHVNTLVTESAPDTSIDSPVDGARKRKFSSSIQISDDQDHIGAAKDDRKRLRPDGELESQTLKKLGTKNKYLLLPSEIWIHIFTFCAPKVLGSLLQVNKSFHSYLVPSSFNSSVFTSSTLTPLSLTPDEIWRASRKRLHLKTPGPLSGKSELDMWKLSCGLRCQFCNKKRIADHKLSQDHWHPGPGESGVASIWSFGIITCGPCLKERSVKVCGINTYPSTLY